MLSPFAPSSLRGNSVAAQRLTEGFRAAGHRVVPCCVEDPDWEEHLKSRLRAGDFPDVCLAMHAWHCADAIDRLHATFARQTQKLPVVISLRGTDLNEMLESSETSERVLRTLATSSGIIVFHPSGREALCRVDAEWHDKIRVIKNGATLPQSSVDYRVKLGISAQTTVFLSIAGLREVKRPLLVLPWLVELHDANSIPPAISYIHVGSALEPDVARSFHDFRSRYQWMHHLEHVPHEEIDSVIRCADVFIAGSRSEGMPHAVCEAMLGGLPMLLSDIEGHRAMATPEIDALFFATRNDFLRQVMRLRNEPGLPTVLARNSMERARKNVSDNREMKEYLEFFENILERCSKSRLL